MILWVAVALAAGACPTSGSVRLFGPARAQWVAAVRAAVDELAPATSPFVIKVGECARASRCLSLQFGTGEAPEDPGDFDMLIAAESPGTALLVQAIVRAPGHTAWMSDYRLLAVGLAGRELQAADIASWATSTITGTCGRAPW